VWTAFEENRNWKQGLLVKNLIDWLNAFGFRKDICGNKCEGLIDGKILQKIFQKIILLEDLNLKNIIIFNFNLLMLQ